MIHPGINGLFVIPKGLFVGWSFPRLRRPFGKGSSGFRHLDPVLRHWCVLGSISLIFTPGLCQSKGLGGVNV